MMKVTVRDDWLYVDGGIIFTLKLRILSLSSISHLDDLARLSAIETSLRTPWITLQTMAPGVWQMTITDDGLNEGHVNLTMTSWWGEITFRRIDKIIVNNNRTLFGQSFTPWHTCRFWISAISFAEILSLVDNAIK